MFRMVDGCLGRSCKQEGGGPLYKLVLLITSGRLLIGTEAITADLSLEAVSILKCTSFPEVVVTEQG
jgi:hypothetical protein